MKKNFLIKIILSLVLIISVLTPLSVSMIKAATYTATVNANKLNVREKAFTKSKILGTLKKGTKVTVYIMNKNGWSTIKYKKKNAYVSTKNLKFTITQSEYYEISKVKGKSLNNTTKAFKSSLIAGDFKTIANKSYDKLEQEKETVSSYINKNIKNKKTRDELIKSYINPAQEQLDRVYYDREMVFALQDTNNLINNIKFEQAHKRFEDVAKYKGQGEASRNTKKLEPLPDKTVSYLDAKTKEIENRFSFSYIEQMPEVIKWMKKNPNILPITKFINNRNQIYTNGILLNEGNFDHSLSYADINLNNYELKGNYTRFTADFALSDYWKSHTVGSGENIATLTIYGSTNYYYHLQDGDEPIHIDVDVRNIDSLSIQVEGSRMVGLVDAKLYREE